MPGPRNERGHTARPLPCHPKRSEGSAPVGRLVQEQILRRFAPQNDRGGCPVLGMRGGTQHGPSHVILSEAKDLLPSVVSSRSRFFVASLLRMTGEDARSSE